MFSLLLFVKCNLAHYLREIWGLSLIPHFPATFHSVVSDSKLFIQYILNKLKSSKHLALLTTLIN